MTTQTPADFSRRVLIAAIGMSPQVLTETLYCLARGHAEPFVPNELHILTTSKGMNIVEKECLDRDSGKLAALLRDYQLDQTMLDHITIHVVTSADGKPLADITTPEDNEQYANLTSRLINRLCADPDSAVHVSIAGGRKTMGYYLGYALSLFGRDQDRLSHVLVQPEYENLPEFFYPTPVRTIIRDRNGRNTLDAAEATVTLASIPFVPMGDLLPDGFKQQLNTFSDAIGAVLRQRQPATMTFLLAERELRVGDYDVKLSPVEYSVLAWIAWRKLQGLPDVMVDNEEGESLALAQEHARFHDQVVLADPEGRSKLLAAYKLTNDYEAQGKRSGITRSDINSHVSHANRKISEVLGEKATTEYGIQRDVIRSRSTTFSVRAPRERIRFEGLPEGWEV
jgi:CRISPR-associated protein (TIGR02584 family)